MRVRSVKVLGYVAALSLASAACGGVGSDTGGSGDSGGSVSGDVKGSMTSLGFSVEDEIAKARVAEVEKAYPDLDLKVTSGAFDEQQFLSAVASGKPPSAVYLSRSELGTYAAKGALLPLDDCIDSQGIDMSVFRESAVSQVTYDGHVYGIPEFNSVRLVLANTSALQDAGLSADDVDVSDWQGVMTASKELYQTGGSGIERIGFDPKIPEFFPLWVAADGGQLVSDDGQTAYLNSPEAVEALTYTISLVDANGGWSDFKTFRDTWDFFGDNNQFVADQLGAFPMEDWYLDVLADVSPDAPIDAMPFKDKEGNLLTYATGQAWSIPKGSDNPAAACAFAKTMTSTDAWLAAAKASKADREKSGGAYLGTWTANSEADDRIFSEVYEPSGTKSLDNAVEVVKSLQDSAIVDPPSPAAAEVQKAWEDAVLRALQGDQTPEEALSQAQEEATAAIADAQ